MHWLGGAKKVNLADVCKDAVDACENVIDSRAEWPVRVALEVLDLGVHDCVATT